MLLLKIILRYWNVFCRLLQRMARPMDIDWDWSFNAMPTKIIQKIIMLVPSDEYRTPLIGVSVDECRCSTNSSWLRLLTYSVGRFSKDNATTVWTACADLKADLTNHEAANWLPEVAFNPDLAPRSRLILSPFSFSYLTLRCLYKICLSLTWKIRNCLLDIFCRLFKDFCQPHP